MKKTLLLFLSLVAATLMMAQTAATQKHEVQPGETMYSLARQYQVTVAALLELNPGLDADHIMAGQKINVPAAGRQTDTTPATAGQAAAQTAQQVQQAQQVPQAQVPVIPNRPRYKTMHEVRKKETIYSISRQYGVTEEQLISANPDLKKGKLKKGAVLNIPYTAAEEAQFKEEQQKAKEEEKPKVTMYPTIKVAVILPFAESGEKMTAEAQKMTNLYQGFLLAVDSLKQRGCNVEVHAYDEVNPATPVGTILQRREMKDMQLIVGPIRQWNVKAVADFAHQQGIAHVVPLSNELALVNEHPTTFQVNPPGTLMHNQVYNRFCLIHKDHNIVFVAMSDKGDNMAYINGFKADLDAKGIKYTSGNVADMAAVQGLLKPGTNNVLIPSSGSVAAFESLCKKLDALNLSSEYTVQLFGFPEWQMLAAKHEKHLSKYQCQFFTSFYSNAGSSRTQQFNARFRKWFNQDQYNSFPKYGELGYDIATYFVKGLNDYGSAFYENLHSFSHFSLEFPMVFEKKNAWSGYQNRSIMIVTRRGDGTVFVR